MGGRPELTGLRLMSDLLFAVSILVFPKTKILIISNPSTHHIEIRYYTKQEIALLYFPDSSPEVANAHLRRWIQKCTPLYRKLLEAGYRKSDKGFFPRQVAIIFDFLGEP